MSTIDEIKARVDIIDLISETVKLRRSGKGYTGFCPFHTNTRTPAFAVFPESGTWRCFGQCNEGGDIFRFVMKKEGWDFAEALRHLAQRAGVALHPVTPQSLAQDEALERLRTLLEAAVNFYRHNLLQTAEGAPALAYLQRRGLSAATIETFGLGYAPNSWEAAAPHFFAKGYTPDDLLQTGLVSERQQGGGIYDRFRNRLMFPIRDAQGRMAGFGARILDPNDVPKFLNSPQTPLFNKGSLLYGLDRARKAIRTRNQAVIVEGYMDVIAAHQAGYENAVSPMGTALTEDQLKLLKRFSRRIVLALDADAAGEKATLRGLELARQALDRTTEVSAENGGIFNARGLIRQEGRLQADLRVATLPAGKDPDEILVEDPAGWENLLNSARPIVLHVMETLAAKRNLDDPKEKAEIAAQVLLLIEDVPNPVERDAYRQQLARLLRVDESSLAGARPHPLRPSRRASSRPHIPQPVIAPTTVAQAAESLERHALRLMLRKPDAVYLLDRTLQRAGLTRFKPEDFENAGYQLLARLVLQSLEQDQYDSPEYILENAGESLLPLIEELRQPFERGEPKPNALIENLVQTVLLQRKTRLERELTLLRYMQEDIQQQDEAGMEGYREMALQYTQTRSRLDRALAQPVEVD